MRQYCRYCAFCSECDVGYYCGKKKKLMTERQIKYVNKCKLYAYTDVGDVIIPDHQYQPRTQSAKPKSTTPKAKQYSLFDEEGETD